MSLKVSLILCEDSCYRLPSFCFWRIIILVCEFSCIVYTLYCLLVSSLSSCLFVAILSVHSRESITQLLSLWNLFHWFTYVFICNAAFDVQVGLIPSSSFSWHVSVLSTSSCSSTSFRASPQRNQCKHSIHNCLFVLCPKFLCTWRIILFEEVPQLK